MKNIHVVAKLEEATKTEFILYNQALLTLKELGLYNFGFAVYGSVGNLYKSYRWFRDGCQFIIVINPYIYNNFTCSIWTSKEQHYFAFYDTYEKSELECLKKLIEIVKNK